jgi:hypothetical protein
MCRVGNWNLSQASLTSPEALAGLRELRTTNPTLHAALTQTIELSEETDNGDGDDPFQGADVYDDCDIPLAVVSDHLLSGGSLAANFVVGVEGGITRCGDYSFSDLIQRRGTSSRLCSSSLSLRSILTILRSDPRAKRRNTKNCTEPGPYFRLC